MRRIFKRLLGIALLGLLGATALFAESFTSANASGWLRSVLLEIRAASRDPGTQWMVYACAVIYFVTFTVLLKRGVRSAERGTRAATPHPLSLPMNRRSHPPLTPPRRGTPSSSASAFGLPSWEGVGVGSGAQISNAFRPWNLSPVEAEREERGTTCNLQPVTCNFLATPDLWLGGLLLIATLHYALNYATASGSTQALMLMVGAALGKGVRLWATWRKAECGTRSAELGAMCQVRGNIEPRTLNIEPRTSSDTENLQPSTCNLQRLLAVLLLLLAVASLWHPETAMQFQYRGLSRWSGPWDNPNIFGLLMGAGVVIGAGLLVASCRLQVAGSFTDELPLRLARGEGRGEVSSVAGSPPGRGQGWVRWLWRLLLLACLTCCSVGLLKSYSRGAWLGTALGLAVLAFQVLRLQVAGAKGGENIEPRTSNPEPRTAAIVGRNRKFPSLFLCLQRNWRPGSILLASILVLCFWQFRYTEFHPVRRAFSVGNQNDFSWRNRVAAWEGALAMMADKPLVGFGWNKPERIYDQFYRPPKVSEGMAIQLNHYFILGMSLGLPALICFAMYLGLALRGNGGWGMASGVWGKEDGERSALNLQCWGTHPRPLRGGDLGTGESGNLDTSPSIPTHEPPEPPTPDPSQEGNSVVERVRIRAPLLGGVGGGFRGTNRERFSSAESLPDRGGEGGQASTLNHQLLTTCRAAVVVLLVGLWFDGGLFNLATASVFWVLLELGRGTVLPACRGEGKAEAETQGQDARATTNPPPYVGGYKFPVSCRSCVSWLSMSFVVALAMTGLFWARARDPFQREWFSVHTSSGEAVAAAVVMPDRGGPFPVVVWCHGAGGSLAGDGETLRQFASLGMAAVGFEYDQRSQTNFDAQFVAVLEAVEGKAEIRKAESGKEHWGNIEHSTSNTEHRRADESGVNGLNVLHEEGAEAEEANRKSPIVNRKSVGWAGNSLGAQRQLSFLARHPERRPVALVRLNGGMVEELKTNAERGTRSAEQVAATTKHTEHTKTGSTERPSGLDTSPLVPLPGRGGEGGASQPATFNVQPATALHAWLAHGENDEVFPASDAKAVAEWLRGRGAAVTLDIFPGRGHGFGEDQALLVRRAAKFCAGQMGATQVVPDNVRSSRWYYWLPVGVLALGFGVWGLGRWRRLTKPIAGVELEGKWSGLTSAATSRWLRWSAAIMAATAVLVSAGHLAVPLLSVRPATLKLARPWCVRPELRGDFDWLGAQPAAKDARIGDLLEHLNLAALQRGQFATSLPENEWREFVLSPWIQGAGEDIAWRRELWEALGPRVRRETEAEQAATVVVRQLCLRVRFQGGQSMPANLRRVWSAGVGTQKDFELLSVAGLRSVGVAARLDVREQCELFYDGKWRRAPRPPLETQP